MPLIHAPRTFSTSAPDLLGLISPIRGIGGEKKEGGGGERAVMNLRKVRSQGEEQQEQEQQQQQQQQRYGEVDGVIDEEREKQERMNEEILSLLPPDLLQHLPATTTQEILATTNTTMSPSSFDDLFSISMKDCEVSNWCESERIEENHELFESFYWDFVEEEKEKKEKEKREKKEQEQEEEKKRRGGGLQMGVIRRYKTMNVE